MITIRPHIRNCERQIHLCRREQLHTKKYTIKRSRTTFSALRRPSCHPAKAPIHAAHLYRATCLPEKTFTQDAPLAMPPASRKRLSHKPHAPAIPLAPGKDFHTSRTPLPFTVRQHGRKPRRKRATLKGNMGDLHPPTWARCKSPPAEPENFFGGWKVPLPPEECAQVKASPLKI